MSESEPVATEVTWNQAAWVTTLGIAFLITAVAIGIIAVLILASLSLARLKIVRRFGVNFGVGFLFSFLNLFLLFGAVFAFPAVVINAFLVTFIYAMDARDGFNRCSRGSFVAARRYILYLLVAVISTCMGGCLVKYTPGVLHKSGEVPALDWHRDFETWEGLGGWLFVNLAFGSLSLIFGSAAETWLFVKDIREAGKEKTD